MIALDPFTTVLTQVIIPIGKSYCTFITVHGLKDDKEHFAECMTGDVLFSRKCDYGQQLNETIDLMQGQSTHQ